jgi:integrase
MVSTTVTPYPSPSSCSPSWPSASRTKGPNDLVFTGISGGALRSQVSQRAVLTRAAKSIGGDGLHPHELRHTAASLAIASGANVKVVPADA